MSAEETIAATGGTARTGPDGSVDLARGAAVGRYLLLGKIGAGGMGVVLAAHDPELDRKVAVKLVLPRADGGADTLGRARLLREAQALAKLAHPNVVAVHDVGQHADGVWIAMEFVAGLTLDAWAKRRPRRWPEVLQALTDAARGVAAAHAAGLVHRDLKPANVMIGDDSRVRVMDFGLAHGRISGPKGREEMSAPQPEALPSRGAAAPPEQATLMSQLTVAGAVQGTPAYMAPEQWQGREAMAASDQFGWCVMAWELLFGERPFAGATAVALAAEVLSGQRRSPQRRRRVPGWLRRVLERGLATDPAQRWPTMSALLTALDRGRRRARMWQAALALSALAAVIGGWEGLRRWDRAEQAAAAQRALDQHEAACAAEGAAIEAVWDEEARRRLRAAFVASQANDPETAARKVQPWLDRQAEAWRRARVEVCRGAGELAQWDAEIREKAEWCLEDRRLELAALVAEFEQAKPVTVQKSVQAASSLHRVDVCVDAEMLRRQPPLPMQGREALNVVRAQLSQATSLELAGETDRALAVAAEARVGAEAWPPLWAAVRAREGVLLQDKGAYAEAERANADAYFTAALAGAWELAAVAAVNSVYTVGYSGARYAEARAWARHAELAIAYAGDSEGLVEAGRLSGIATLDWARGDYAAARDLFARALVIRERVLGPDHPEVAATLGNLAAMYQATGDYAEAIVQGKRALAIGEAALGREHPHMAIALGNLANVYEAMGAEGEARPLYERALAIQERATGPEHPDYALTLNNLAIVIMATGSRAEARAMFERVLAIQERTLERGHPVLVLGLVNLVELDLADKRHDDVVARAERAVAIVEAHEGVQEGEFEAHLTLARALIATGGDRKRALTEARMARDGLRGIGADKTTNLGKVETWLAEHWPVDPQMPE